VAFGERQPQAVVVEIARLAETRVERAGRRIRALAEEEQPGIDRGAEIIVARIAGVPGLEAAGNVVARHVTQFGQREEHVALAGGHSLLVKLPHGFVGMAGGQIVELEAMQNRDRGGTGFAGA
jgi:hypothetical protein